MRSENADSQEELMNARLQSVNLKIEASEKVSSKDGSTMETQINTEIFDENSESYKEKIKLFIEMEKMKLVCRAIQIGLPEKDIMGLLDEENIADFDLENLKSRILIK
jgi:hypothetical protein